MADFQQLQQQFTDYMRQPSLRCVPKSIKPERFAVYRELIFNNIESFISSGFPVLRKILTDTQWLELVDAFFRQHRCETPYFSEISEEFLVYLQNERQNAEDYPFLLELAHYEWVEMALAISTEEVPEFMDFQGDWLTQKARISPLAWSLAYSYPVHQISPDFLPTETSPTYLIVYRAWDDEVHFIQSSPLTFRLLQIIEENPEQTIADHLEQIAEESQQPNTDAFSQNGLVLLQHLFHKSIITLA